MSRLHKGPKISAFVGKHPNREYIFEVPKAILLYFSPTLRPLLQNSDPKAYLLLEQSDKKAASWLLRWMLNGGVEKTYDNAPPLTESPTEWVVHRLALVTGFGVQGLLHERMVKEVHKLMVHGVITAKHLQWIYKPHVPLPVKQLGQDIAFFVVESVLNGNITSGIEGARQNPILKSDIASALQSKRGRIYHMQRKAKQPLTVFQVQFVYLFTPKGSELRKMVPRDLLRLIDSQAVVNVPYQEYAQKNEDFRADMANAIDEANARRAEYHRTQNTAGNAPQQDRRVPAATGHRFGSAVHVAAAAPAPTTTRGETSAALSSFPVKSTRPRKRVPRGAKRTFVNTAQTSNPQPGPTASSSSIPTGPKAEQNPTAPKGPRAQRNRKPRQAPKTQSTPSGQPVSNTQQHPSPQHATHTHPALHTPNARPHTNRAGIKFTVSPESTTEEAAAPPAQILGTRLESEVVLRITGDGGLEREK